VKGISLIPSRANDDSVFKGSSPGQERTGATISSSAMGNLKEQRKSESNIQIHPSFTHRVDHGEEGIKHHR
jgi:hypothetical protein